MNPSLEFEGLSGVDQQGRRAALAVHTVTRLRSIPPSPASPPPRRRTTPVVAVGFAVLALFGLAVTRLAGDGGGGPEVVPASEGAAHYAPSWLPEGFEDWTATDAIPNRGASRVTVVWDGSLPDALQAPAAMVFTSPASPDVELRSFVPAGPAVETVTVQGVEGLAYGDGARRGVVFGPLAGTVVTMQASGLDAGAVFRLAEAVRIVDGRERIDPEAAGARFRTAEMDVGIPFYLLTGGGGGPAAAVVYVDGPAPGNAMVSVMVSGATEGLAPLLHIALSDVTATEVAGTSGTLGAYAGLSWMFSGPQTLVALAVVDDHVVAVTTEGVSREDTRRLAASLRPVSTDQWRAWRATLPGPAVPASAPGVEYTDEPRTMLDTGER